MASKKIIACKACGGEVAKSANKCPHCGAKRSRPGVALACILICVITLIAILNIDYTEDTPAAVDKNKINQDSTSGESTNNPHDVDNDASGSTPEVFGVGDTAELYNIHVTLLSVTESYGRNYISPSAGKVFIICEFEIYNNSSSGLGVSSMLSFDAYVDEYAVELSLNALLTTDMTQLDGSAAPGKKIKGCVAYEADADWSTLEIRFAPSIWANAYIPFVYNK